MAERESGDGVGGVGRLDGGEATARDEAQCGAGGDEFVTTLASTSSSRAESGEFVSAGMSEVQIAAAIRTSREQGWSEVAERGGDGADAASCGRSAVDDRRVWEELKQWHPDGFRDWGDRVKLGRVIAEGGQAVIYEASEDGCPMGRMVAKVFKMEGFSLADLRRQWPLMTKKSPRRGNRGFFGQSVVGVLMFHCSYIRGATYLKDGKFAFLMRRCWGDLRTLINLKLSDPNFKGPPPFRLREALKITEEIADGILNLHARGILHRDLKAANVLIEAFGSCPMDDDSYWCAVADYESSMLVVGTGFWRAPEVLEQLLRKPCDREDGSKIWTEQVDVYSYAMTCYEVWTGHTPFFGYERKDWKRVIDGERPHLPDYIPCKVRELVERCWHKEPSQRPTFQAIVDELSSIGSELRSM